MDSQIRGLGVPESGCKILDTWFCTAWPASCGTICVAYRDMRRGAEQPQAALHSSTCIHLEIISNVFSSIQKPINSKHCSKGFSIFFWHSMATIYSYIRHHLRIYASPSTHIYPELSGAILRSFSGGPGCSHMPSSSVTLDDLVTFVNLVYLVNLVDLVGL